MKPIKTKYYILPCLLLLLLLMINCKRKNATQEKIEIPKTETSKQETPPTIAELTEAQMQSVGVTLGSIERKELTSTTKANGLLKVPNNKKATLTPLYGGVIQSIKVQIGDIVKQGQVLATISNPEYMALQEQYLTTKSRLSFAQEEYTRQQELFDNGVGAKKNLQRSSTELKSLRTQLFSLQRQLQLMGIPPDEITNGNLRSTLIIKAPISGTISNIQAQIGSYVNVSSPILGIIDNDSIHLDLQVFEKDLPKMQIGQIVHFRLTNNPDVEYDAKIYSIGSSFENESKTISVHANVTGNKTGLIDGMNITGIVSLDKSTTPAIPEQAIVEADGKYYIFVKTDKKATAQPEETEKIEEQTKKMNFEKIEIIKGVSDMGYTAFTCVTPIASDAKIVVKASFFVNAKLSAAGEHED